MKYTKIFKKDIDDIVKVLFPNYIFETNQYLVFQRKKLRNMMLEAKMTTPIIIEDSKDSVDFKIDVTKFHLEQRDDYYRLGVFHPLFHKNQSDESKIRLADDEHIKITVDDIRNWERNLETSHYEVYHKSLSPLKQKCCVNNNILTIARINFASCYKDIELLCNTGKLVRGPTPNSHLQYRRDVNAIIESLMRFGI